MKVFEIENDIFSLVDCQARALEHPKTFEVSGLEKITSGIKESMVSNLAANVKLIFDAKCSDHAERMWVLIKDFKSTDDVHTGYLNNDPLTEETARDFEKFRGMSEYSVSHKFGLTLKCGDEIKFTLKNVADVI